MNRNLQVARVPELEHRASLRELTLERRHHPRYQLRVPVLFHWSDALGRKHQGAGFSRDLSTAGLFVNSDYPPPPGTDIEIEILLPSLESDAADGLRLRAHGTVRRAISATEPTGFAASADLGMVPDSDRK